MITSKHVILDSSASYIVVHDGQERKVKNIRFDGARYRSDIGFRALKDESEVVGK